MLNLRELFLGGPMRLSHVKRFGVYPCLFSESVAEHTFYVMLYSWLLAKQIWIRGKPDPRCELDVGKLLTIAILHDFGEIAMGDLNGVVKHSPGMQPALQAIKDAEHQATDDSIGEVLGRAVCMSVEQLRNTMEFRCVQVADYMCVLAFISREWNVGNQLFVDSVDCAGLVKRGETMLADPKFDLFIPILKECLVWMDVTFFPHIKRA